MRFVRAYTAVFSVTLLVTTLPTGIQGLVHARSLSDAQYNNSISVGHHLWLMIAGFFMGVAFAQSLYTRCRRGRLRAYELAVAIFLGLWVAVGTSFAFATAEWSGLILAGVTSIVAPLVPWTEAGASLRRRATLSLIALAALGCIWLSSAQFLDSSFLFYVFAAPLAALGGTLGVLGAERIVERERVPREIDPVREDALRQLRASRRSVA